jgi:hypothetical protein
MSIDCSEFYQQNILSLYPSVNIDGTIPSVYTKGITMGKEGIKNNKKHDEMSFTETTLPTILILSAKSICKSIGKLFSSP